ncbi:PIG-L family deacetylase [Pedobacter chitinilyticus]|uniref:PIG-L family deacetylase n=1 Tax=Pedobacter chitinilyticus TaxID=2233776 RepID=A0A443YNP3_9SPHI|nr:PIG-L family deacetylase [Pedobacter chitinilyticus]RWU05411.1 PIG-L family deacetylase [Pedobacter chitinilyticus]
MNIRRFFLAAMLLPCFLKAQVQQPNALNAAEIAQGIATLSIKGSVLYIAAHPDDENTRLLAYLAKEAKVRTAYLSLTRGDGGQNLIGNEQAELLGQIRTQELLAARNIDGAGQFFSRANDFGFSKTSAETFKIWGKEQILADAVWIIRKFRPDVIITRFPEDARAGHGHHAASAIIAREAFVAAADPKQFPEQLKKGVTVWQAKRILWNTYNFGGNNTTAPDQLKINVGVYNPLLGKNYGEIAAISRTNHKSQGFGSALQRGEAFEYFSHTAGEPAKTSLFDGINIGLSNKEVISLLAKIQQQYQLNQPAASLPDLLKLKKLAVKEQGFNQPLLDEMIAACAGLWAEAVVPEASYAVGDSIAVTVNAIYRASAPLKVRASINGKEIDLQENRLSSSRYGVKANPLDITQPYYLKKEHPIGYYVIDRQEEIGYPENPSSLTVKAMFSINDELIELNLPILYKSADPIKGELYQPLVIAPQVTASLSDQAYLFVNKQPKTIEVNLKSFTKNVSGELIPILPSGWKASPEKIDFKFSQKGDAQLAVFQVTPGAGSTAATLRLQVKTNGQTESKGFKTIRYDHIPNINLFPEATAKLEVADLKIAGKRIAYIDGAGDLVANALQQVGYQVVHLTPSQVLLNDLSAYDAIVTGVRFFNVNEEAKNIYSKLMDYVKNGGVLLEQYNVNNGLKSSTFGPYPFRLVNKRVTEEDAAITFTKPAHAALNYPNKITSKDFEGWVQERGLYFAEDIDPKYETVLRMSDTGEAASDGSLLIADYGKGKFVYTSLSFFRQLPAGVSGAYRLFANLLAKPL